MALDSDINNADSALKVKFYQDAIKNDYRSGIEGRPYFDDVIMIEISIPGRLDSIVVRPAYEEDKRRFPFAWATYNNQQNEAVKEGTPIEELPGMTRAIVENLKALRFYTLEQGANASDQALQSLQMKIGMGPEVFRDRCRRYLAHATTVSAQTKLEQELAARDDQIAAMQGQIKAMQEMVASQQEVLMAKAEMQAAQASLDLPDKARDKAA